MNESDYHQLIETSWRRPLSPEEQARLQSWIAAHPGQATDLEAEEALTRALTGLPDAPVPSNFTARVLGQIERDSLAEERRCLSGWRRAWSGGSWRRWFPRLAATGLAVAIGLAGYGRFREHQAARTMARSIEVAHAISGLEHPEALQDFDLILHLSHVPARPGDGAVDLDLLAALQ